MDKIIHPIETHENKAQIIIDIETEYIDVITNIKKSENDNLLEVNL